MMARAIKTMQPYRSAKQIGPYSAPPRYVISTGAANSFIVRGGVESPPHFF